MKRCIPAIADDSRCASADTCALHVVRGAEISSSDYRGEVSGKQGWQISSQSEPDERQHVRKIDMNKSRICSIILYY